MASSPSFQAKPKAGRLRLRKIVICDGRSDGAADIILAELSFFTENAACTAVALESLRERASKGAANSRQKGNSQHEDKNQS